MSQVSVDGSRDKARILSHPRHLLVLFQATALRHRPFCLEHPKLEESEQASLEEKEVRQRGGVEKVGGGFVKGLTVVSPCCPHYLPSSCSSFLPLDGTPDLFPANMLHCSATPQLAPLFASINFATLTRRAEHDLF